MSGGAPYAGVELGGTKCVALLAHGPYDVIDRLTVATTTPDETLGALEQALAGWREELGIRALGIASFGPVDLVRASATYGFITTTTKPGWQQIDVAARLGAAAGVAPAFDTDVNGAALAELRWGAGQSADDLAYVTVGTGVGVGLIVGGRPVHGFGHPELGHVRVAQRPGEEWPGVCPFHGSCVEGLASGPAIEARLAGRPLQDVGAEDPVWDSVAWAIAQLAHVLVCAAAPRIILLGGGVIERQPHLLARVEALLDDSLAGYVALPAERPYIRPPTLGAMAGPLGAIALAAEAC